MSEILTKIENIRHLESGNFFLIAGPCVIEDEMMPFRIAENIVEITDRLNIPYIFKASFRKANRSSIESFTGIGDMKAIKVIRDVGRKFKIPTLTDIHNAEEAKVVADYADVLQIPAFLCRQTEILEAAAKTGRVINIKKGQFLSAASMKFVVEKVQKSGNHQIILTERGNMFGYGDLVVDFRNIYEMKKFELPVVLDVTHSLQQPNQPSGISGGKPELIGTIARAGIAAGADGLFIETHPEPSEAKSDGANMLKLGNLEYLLSALLKIHKALK